jgi:enoyl-CoA hydratase
VAEFLSVERDGEVAVVRIDRPPANAMNVQLLEEGAAVQAELAADPPAAVAMVGRPRFFSAGVDLKLVPTLTEHEQRAMVDGINRLFFGWYGFPAPLVCGVTGHAIAGGMILALCGDFRVGAAEGKLGLTEVKAGVPYPACALAVVRAELSPAAARELALRAELIDPARALALGALDEVVAPEEVEGRAIEVARELAALPAVAYRRTKERLRAEALAEMRAVIEGGGDDARDAWLDADAGAAATRILDPGAHAPGPPRHQAGRAGSAAE